MSCQTFPLSSRQFWALKWLKFQNQPDFWKIPNLNFLVVLELSKKFFINGWKKQCHFCGFLNMLTLLILRNPKKWHCFFQPLIKIFHFSIVLKNSKTTKKFKLGIFQKSGWFWNLSHLSAQNWHENKGKVWQDTLYIY